MDSLKIGGLLSMLRPLNDGENDDNPSNLRGELFWWCQTKTYYIMWMDVSHYFLNQLSWAYKRSVDVILCNACTCPISLKHFLFGFFWFALSFHILPSPSEFLDCKSNTYYQEHMYTFTFIYIFTYIHIIINIYIYNLCCTHEC